MKNDKPIVINTISELHRLANLEKPLHPMVSVIKFEEMAIPEEAQGVKAIFNLYCLFLKKNVKGKFKYGQDYYDFDEGVLGMNGPGQVMKLDDQYEATGWGLVFHPDFIQGYPLAQSIKKYGFFSYAVHEALHVSAQEERLLESIFQNIENEYHHSIDAHSQDMMISQLELLFNYTNRYYSRQFITRKNASQSIIANFETVLSAYFEEHHGELPNVQYFSDQLHVSTHYLSDLLRKYTGQNTQQHIHKKIIEIAKEKLSTTDLSVSEIAYELGFEHSQSFNKLFKSKTQVTPLEYHKSFL